MSYAIVRNEKLTRAGVNGKCTHNDRKAKCHTNKDIDPTKTHLNYYIKKNNYTYTKEFDKLRKEQNLAGHLRENSIIMCQMIFTSDQEFFNIIEEQIIKPQNTLIKELHNENIALHKELSKQTKIIDVAEKYEKEKFNLETKNRNLRFNLSMFQ